MFANTNEYNKTHSKADEIYLVIQIWQNEKFSNGRHLP